MTPPVPVLVLGTRPPRSLCRRLTETGLFQMDLAPELPSELGRHRVLLLAGPQRPLTPEGAHAVARFLEGGGGLVALGGTLDPWWSQPALRELSGPPPSRPGPVTELVVTPLPGHPITDRLEPELRITDRVHLDLVPPPAARLLFTVSWRFSERPVGFALDVGSGRFVHLDLGAISDVASLPAYRQIVHRCLRHAAGLPRQEPVRVGMLGYGAIGREHAESIGAVQGLRLAAVCDRSEVRRREVESIFQVPTCEGLEALLEGGAGDLDLVVVGVPPSAHAEAVGACLGAGKHVVCEKPFALTRAETAAMMEAAESAGRVLTVYQSRRWDPDFAALSGAVARGDIGEPFYMESFIGGFSHPCGYWHSHEEISGGTIYDWGSHYFDWVLLTFPAQVTRVSAAAHKRVWHDVTNSDQVRVDLTFADGAQASFLQSDIAAALKPKWYLLGTRGAIVGDWRLASVTSRAWTGDLVEERLLPAESPALVRVFRPDGGGGAHEEALALPRRVPHGFYRNLADHLIEGEPLAVRPEEAARTVAVMEAAHASVTGAGRPVRVRI
ncbi:MAG: Gfo/Idh/MocA family protein [Candidatus Dormibacterales bacterium]